MDPWNPYPIRGPYFNILDHGAVGDNHTLNTQAIQATINTAAAKGGGYVVVPSGVFFTGSVNLSSNCYLLLRSGAILQGSAYPEHYNWDWDYWHIINSVNTSNTGVIGPQGSDIAMGGEIRGPMWQMIAMFNTTKNMYQPKNWKGVHGCVGECRPKNIAFIDAINVTISQIHVSASSDWTQLFRRCHNVLEDHVLVTGSNLWPNNDGIDFESGTNLTISNSEMHTGDDCIAMRSGNCNNLRTPWPEPADHISPLIGVKIKNMTLSSTSCAIKIEELFQKDHGDLKDVHIDSVVIRNTNRGIGIWQRLGIGKLANIYVSNIDLETSYQAPNWWGSGEPIVVTSVPENRIWLKHGLTGIQNVTFVNITARSEGSALFSARDQQQTRSQVFTHIRLHNVSIIITRFGNVTPHPQHDYRPINGDMPTPMAISAPVDGIFVENANITLTNCSVGFLKPMQPYWSRTCVNVTKTSHVTYKGMFHCSNSSH